MYKNKMKDIGFELVYNGEVSGIFSWERKDLKLTVVFNKYSSGIVIAEHDIPFDECGGYTQQTLWYTEVDVYILEAILETQHFYEGLWEVPVPETIKFEYDYEGKVQRGVIPNE